ncbi:MAG: CBM2 / GH18, partial [uncultured Corynebacteriales bacterium]
APARPQGDGGVRRHRRQRGHRRRARRRRPGRGGHHAHGHLHQDGRLGDRLRGQVHRHQRRPHRADRLAGRVRPAGRHHGRLGLGRSAHPQRHPLHRHRRRLERHPGARRVGQLRFHRGVQRDLAGPGQLPAERRELHRRHRTADDPAAHADTHPAAHHAAAGRGRVAGLRAVPDAAGERPARHRDGDGADRREDLHAGVHPVRRRLRAGVERRRPGRHRHRDGGEDQPDPGGRRRRHALRRRLVRGQARRDLHRRHPAGRRVPAGGRPVRAARHRLRHRVHRVRECRRARPGDQGDQDPQGPHAGAEGLRHRPGHPDRAVLVGAAAGADGGPQRRRRRRLDDHAVRLRRRADRHGSAHRRRGRGAAPAAQDLLPGAFGRRDLPDVRDLDDERPHRRRRVRPAVGHAHDPGVRAGQAPGAVHVLVGQPGPAVRGAGARDDLGHLLRRGPDPVGVHQDRRPVHGV